MMDSNLSAQDTSSQFVHNLVHFGRLLRSAGLPIGTGRILDAVRAVNLAGFGDREDFLLDTACGFRKPPSPALYFRPGF